MYKNILYKKQLDNIELLSLFSSKFYLAGGTAIALQLGHRKSIDFDFFSYSEIDNFNILNILTNNKYNIDRICR